MRRRISASAAQAYYVNYCDHLSSMALSRPADEKEEEEEEEEGGEEEEKGDEGRRRSFVRARRQVEKEVADRTTAYLLRCRWCLPP